MLHPASSGEGPCSDVLSNIDGVSDPPVSTMEGRQRRVLLLLLLLRI